MVKLKKALKNKAKKIKQKSITKFKPLRQKIRKKFGIKKKSNMAQKEQPPEDKTSEVKLEGGSNWPSIAIALVIVGGSFTLAFGAYEEWQTISSSFSNAFAGVGDAINTVTGLITSGGSKVAEIGNTLSAPVSAVVDFAGNAVTVGATTANEAVGGVQIFKEKAASFIAHPLDYFQRVIPEAYADSQAQLQREQKEDAYRRDPTLKDREHNEAVLKNLPLFKDFIVNSDHDYFSTQTVRNYTRHNSDKN